MSALPIVLVSLLLQSTSAGAPAIDRGFTVAAAGEAVATIAAGCERCDWASKVARRCCSRSRSTAGIHSISP